MKMRYLCHCRTFVLTALMLGCLPALQAQEEDLVKSLVLVKPYQPSVSDAGKTAAGPAVSDTLHLLPEFTYRPDRKTGYMPLTVDKSGPMLPEADTMALSHGYLSSDFGNYRTRDISAGYHTTSLRNNAFGVDLTHYSSRGKVRLLNGVRVPAKQSDNQIKAFGRHYAENVVWSLDAVLSRRVTHAYGYNYYLLPDTVLSHNRGRYFTTDVEGRARSKAGVFRYDFDVAAGQNVIKDNHDNRERHKYAAGTVSDDRFTLDFAADYINRKGFDTLKWVGSVGGTLYASEDLGWGELKVGIASYFVKEDGLKLKMRVWPDVSIVHPAGSASLYAGLRGGMALATYHDLLMENPYLQPGSIVSHAYTPWCLYGGVQGTVPGMLRYEGELMVLRQNNTPFFTGHPDGVENHFDVISDDMMEFTARAGLSWRILPVVNLEASGAYHAYDTRFIAKPWHMPKAEASAVVSWKVMPELTVSATADMIGSRYGRLRGGDAFCRKLKPVTEYGFMAEYRLIYNSRIYIKINNLTSQQYERWTYYPGQKFNFVIGSHLYFK